ncbi:hypothetical protein BJ170DRAFT_591012 [Xylariales sp. AK1849]|nr:hypothetical protein BJ170DRAFT_591012 [Xylariales sp. AK1849]
MAFSETERVQQHTSNNVGAESSKQQSGATGSTRDPGKSPGSALNVSPSKVFRIPAVPNIAAASVSAKAISEAYNTWADGRSQRKELHANGAASRMEFQKNQEFFRQKLVPSVETFGGGVNRYLRNRDWMQLFQTFLSVSNIVACFLEVTQGASELEKIGIKIHGELQAQTGLDAPKKFARQVDKHIRRETGTVHSRTVHSGDCEHLYFLYHPDNDWYVEFHGLVSDKAAPDNFLGMSDNLHAICAWMLFLRKRATKSATKARFHLLIPSYRPMAVK